MSVGFSISSLAVLAWLRMAAVSSRRAIRLASASFRAAVTLFISSFMSPGRIRSRIPTETTSRPISVARRRRPSSSSRATASFSTSSWSSSRTPITPRSSSWASRYSDCRRSSDWPRARRGSVTLNVTTALTRRVTLSAVMISWPPTSTCDSRRSSVTIRTSAAPFQKAYEPGGRVSTYRPSMNSTPA